MMFWAKRNPLCGGFRCSRNITYDMIFDIKEHIEHGPTTSQMQSIKEFIQWHIKDRLCEVTASQELPLQYYLVLEKLLR